MMFRTQFTWTVLLCSALLAGCSKTEAPAGAAAGSPKAPSPSGGPVAPVSGTLRTSTEASDRVRLQSVDGWRILYVAGGGFRSEAIRFNVPARGGRLRLTKATGMVTVVLQSVDDPLISRRESLSLVESEGRTTLPLAREGEFTMDSSSDYVWEMVIEVPEEADRKPIR